MKDTDTETKASIRKDLTEKLTADAMTKLYELEAQITKLDRKIPL